MLSIEILADILLLGFSPLPPPLRSAGAESPCKRLLQFFSSGIYSMLSFSVCGDLLGYESFG